MKIPFCGEIPPHLDHLEWQESSSSPYLAWQEGRLWMIDQNERFSIDLIGEWYYHYKKRYCLSKEPLAKALGIKGNPGLSVWDITCGLGKDSLLMLSFGAKVRAFEKDPQVAALLMDGIYRGSQDTHLGKVLSERFSLELRDAQTVEEVAPSVIYLDPMYDFINKKARAHLGMEFLRKVVTPEDSAQALLDWAISKNPKRVVIKRAIRAPSLNPNPKVVYRGKSTRYDMYIPSEVAESN